MVPGKSGVPRLYLCSKIPLHDRNGAVVGIAGIKRPYEYSADDSAGYSRLINVIAYVTEHYAGDITVTDMANHVSLSDRDSSAAPPGFQKQMRLPQRRPCYRTYERSLGCGA